MKLQISVASIFVGLGMLAANNSHAANTCQYIYYKNAPVHVFGAGLRIPAGKVNFTARACWDCVTKKAAPYPVSDNGAYTATTHRGNFWFADGIQYVTGGASNYFVEGTNYKTFATSWTRVSVKTKFNVTFSLGLTGGSDTVGGSGTATLTLTPNNPAELTVRSRTDYAGKCQLEVNDRVVYAWQPCSNFSTP